MALERALVRILYPLMARELKAKLLDEAKQSIIRVITFTDFVLRELFSCSIDSLKNTCQHAFVYRYCTVLCK